MQKKIFTVVAIASTTIITGCNTIYHNKQIQQSADQNLTVGTVQREIRIGMSTADVIAILGSPNIVTTDAERREVWVYDKISTETAYSQSNVGGSILILGASASSGAKSTSQKTLTVIIKFDAQSKVRDFAYHTSKF
ncbi:hypothetical protein EJJ36_14265 [Acinetobacter junii]|jgi:outer membrane protein assembly factor BamE (lipoprotein component of BamABCDE complex)|uniref:hypothetical protein n=1 Tax=Acinetobacter TaxID=469 RepID=UPI000F7F5A5B|nr:hypothetical protein [Acinetobacter junii]RTE44926.1 hypothetical protein EJJ36_14265 [Acinetobacter junii]UAA86794.1 hypothetical protein H2787_18460 [Acinetobacter baumannii]